MLRKIINSKLCPILGSKIMSQSREKVPIIMQLKGNDVNFRKKLNSLSNTDLNKNLPLINSYAGYMTTENIYKILDNPEISYISFDSKVYTLLDIATPAMEAYFPHDRGYKGEGITIAVIDTGTSSHRDLTIPDNRIIGFKDFVKNKTEPYDDNGHGTHVTGIIAGNGYSSNGKYTGVAPKANILSIKVLDENGSSNTSDLIDAIDYVIKTKGKFNTKIINMSLGTPATTSCNKDPLCRAVSAAIRAGLVVVTAAGNSGPQAGTILSPGISKDAITVGAVDDKRTIDPSDDTIAPFSSRGPINEGYEKPDIVAPGVNINSLSNTKIDSYSSLSGTSMATPLVSGAIALLFNRYPNIRHSEVKEKLLDSCVDLNDSKENQGAGLLNLKLLFKDDKNHKDDTINNKPPKSNDLFGGDMFENIIMIGIILFLLDSRL